ncbi:MAG: hypothetical protein GWO07_12580 [Candidatus Dadabacteria bacterium]|nr:hypothetical protein [Candidatus Dadabacteria bacterium]NIS09571.1 hypothetical protein [Candidatus Dadabacteria bacterium]NIV43080.1 hypothetical protein [Candidatus Dadabacteria bacterium]NIX16045.1 hypothetical protein [Candidatus Dadabacteria bacterium]NIY22748.1 hypothetical protein [Candidatus Dadabacteria bacterium]
MAIKIVKEELEAKLNPLGSTTFFSKPRAKIERKVYGDGKERLKLLISNFKVPDSDEVELLINGVVITAVKIKNGRAQLDLRSENGDSFPKLSLNDTAEIRYKENVIVKGRFYAD